MPGPEEFRRDIREAKRFGVIQVLALLLSGLSLVLTIALAVTGSWLEAAVTAGFCAAFAAMLAYHIRRQERLRRETTQYYTFPLPRAFDYETVCSTMAAVPGIQWTHICDEAARICRIKAAFSWRVALLHQPIFSNSDYKAQRDRANQAASRAHPSKKEGPRWEIESMARIYLVVCDDINDALSRYISTHTQQLLTRNECIVNMAVVGDRLLIPPVRGADVDLPSLNRCFHSVDLIWSQLSRNSTEPRIRP